MSPPPIAAVWGLAVVGGRSKPRPYERKINGDKPENQTGPVVNPGHSGASRLAGWECTWGRLSLFGTKTPAGSRRYDCFL